MLRLWEPPQRALHLPEVGRGGQGRDHGQPLSRFSPTGLPWSPRRHVARMGKWRVLLRTPKYRWETETRAKDTHPGSGRVPELPLPKSPGAKSSLGAKEQEGRGQLALVVLGRRGWAGSGHRGPACPGLEPSLWNSFGLPQAAHWPTPGRESVQRSRWGSAGLGEGAAPQIQRQEINCCFLA